MLTLSLVLIARDEEEAIEGAIQSVEEFCDEIIVFDTGSQDGTFEKALRLADRVYRLPVQFLEMDFGQSKSIVSGLARGAYIFNLDADERLTGGEHLISAIEWMEAANLQAVSFPRRRWADLQQTKQIELEAYPDYQSRLYRNAPTQIRWSRALHEELTVKATPIERFPIFIEHHCDHFHLSNPERANNRLRQRMALAERAGVKVEGSPEALRLAKGLDTGR